MDYINLKENLIEILNDEFAEIDDDEKLYDDVSERVLQLFSQMSKEVNSDIERLRQKLDVIYNNEKHYLNLVKEYKEEIKFINTTQEELRRERAQFFSQNLKQVYDSLKESQVEGAVAAKWIEELVNSYTSSLDVSSELINSQIIDNMSNLKKQSNKEIKDLTKGNMEEVALDEK